MVVVVGCGRGQRRPSAAATPTAAHRRVTVKREEVGNRRRDATEGATDYVDATASEGARVRVAHKHVPPRALTPALPSNPNPVRWPGAAPKIETRGGTHTPAGRDVRRSAGRPSPPVARPPRENDTSLWLARTSTDARRRDDGTGDTPTRGARHEPGTRCGGGVRAPNGERGATADNAVASPSVARAA